MAARGDISDEELRRQLQALGEKVGPVTNTTRPLLLRKLERLLNEPRSSRISKEKTPPRRRTSPGRKSSPATTRNQSPSRRLIGFSSDEEDSGPSHSSTFIDTSKFRGRRREETASNAGSDKSKPSPSLRRSNLRQRVPSFIDSVPESTADTTDGNSGEFSDRDGQVYHKPTIRLSGLTRNWRTVRRDRDESERSETVRSSSNHDKRERVIAESELNTTLEERQAGARDPNGSSFWSSTVKILLVISAICIFILLYATLKNHLSEIDLLKKLAKLPVCKGHKELKKYNDDKPPDCVPLVNISDQYVDSLYKKLTTKAGLFECQDPTVESRNFSLEEFKRQIREDNYKRKSDEQMLILNNTLKLIVENPDWKLRLFDESNTLIGSVELIRNVAWIDSSVSMKPILCRIKEAMSRLAYLSFVVGFGIGGLMVFYFIVRQRWRREEEETRMMYKFVENIIDILREHHEASKTEKNLLPYLPIPHVRDMLIPPSDRQRLSKAWNRAVRFLSANESRIRVESQRIAGEDFEVWRWIQVATPKPHSPKLSRSGDKRGKYWQGQAFENFQSAVNPPVISPTPCLKIRNMFDPDVETEDGWHVMIQDAILEKCIENGAGVVHIAVDKSSSEGCVYVKCDTHHSAGLAFRSLHGCWFDGRLVAVKYLTLKRYHQRFPVALEATERLSPSGSSPSSLITFDPDEAGDEDINDSDIEL